METEIIKVTVPKWLRLWQHLYNILAGTVGSEQITLASTPIEYEQAVVDNKAMIADKLHSMSNRELLDEHNR